MPALPASGRRRSASAASRSRNGDLAARTVVQLRRVPQGPSLLGAGLHDQAVEAARYEYAMVCSGRTGWALLDEANGSGLTRVQPLLDDEERRCDPATVRGTEQQGRKPAEHAGHLSGLSGAGGAQRRWRTRDHDDALGYAVVAARDHGCNEETGAAARSKRAAGRLQGAVAQGA